MRRTGKAFGTLAAATSLAMVGGGLALADDVNMDPQSMSVLAGEAGTFTVQLDKDNSGTAVDPVAGCNATEDAPVTISFTADDAWATIEPASVSVTDCVTVKTVSVSVASGTAPEAKTKVLGAASGGLQDQAVRVTTGSGKDKITTIEYVDSGFKGDFLNLHVDTPAAVIPPGGGGDPAPDADGDGVADSSDNCINTANADQADVDGDASGDACDSNSYSPSVGTAAFDDDGTEGDTLTAGGSFTDRDGNDSVTLSADNGSNGTFTDHRNGTWTWSRSTTDDVESGTITVTASDGEHTSASDAFAYSASNADPAVSAVTQTRASACEVTLGAAFSDAGSSDTHTTSVAWADGSTAGLTRTFTAAGSYAATVTVTDDDGGDGSRATGVRAYNRPSVIAAPINTTGTRSSFKAGSTIPVKITVTGCDNQPVSTLTPAVHLDLNDTTADVAVNETAYTEVPTNGKLMRWSDTQYIYNLSTKLSQFTGSALTQGTYTVSVNDPSFQAPVKAAFDLKK